MNGKIFLLLNYLTIILMFEVADASDDCTSKQDCRYLGKCVGDPGDRHCDCIEGISGKNCEIIDECDDNPDMCGSDPDAVCSFERKHRRAHCECNSFGKRFDVVSKRCVEQKPCQNQKQCLNGGVCANEDHKYEGEGRHYCECKFDTSGDFCELIHECIDNPNYCGDGEGVKCSYNTYLERAYCQCLDQNQRFDWPLKKCVDRKKCRTHEDCLPFGVCHNKCTAKEACLDYDHVEEKHSCHCVEGTSGEHCEIIDDCYNKVLDCGTSDKVACDYYYNHGLTAFAYCRCQDPTLKFDHVDKECKSNLQ